MQVQLAGQDLDQNLTMNSNVKKVNIAQLKMKQMGRKLLTTKWKCDIHIMMARVGRETKGPTT
jgi:hypothetical protein